MVIYDIIQTMYIKLKNLQSLTDCKLKHMEEYYG